MAQQLPEPDWARVFDVAPAPFLLLTPDLVIVHANEARLEATATTLEEQVGRPLFDVFPINPEEGTADGMEAVRDSLYRVRDSGRAETMPILKYDIRMPDGTFVERFWSPRNVPVLDDDGRVVLLLHRSDDVTDYVRLRQDAEGAAGVGDWREQVTEVQADLLARTRELEQVAGELRASGERERRTARALAGLAATASALAATENRTDLLRVLFERGRTALDADLLAVALRTPEGDLAVSGAPGPDAAERERRLPATSPLPMAVAARGRRVLVADPATAAPDAVLPGAVAWVALPMRAGGRLVGSLTVGWARPHDLHADDVQVLEAFAAQCGQAVDRVARLEAERRAAHATRTLAETLQRSLLTEPPRVAGLQIAARYRPAAREAQVGGDWFDAFRTPDRRATTLVIGDVTGHDRRAAARMGQVRNMLRGIAMAVDGTPSRVLGALDCALRDLGMTTLVTGVLGQVSRDARGAWELRWSNAGHPPPLLLAPDGTAELLWRPRELLLGVDAETGRSDHTQPLPVGSTVVLYTDGLVERRDATLDDGLARLLDTGGRLAGRTAEEVCDGLLAGMVPDASDDVALLALRVTG
ncbi:SpoIIE family protein phosphatase [Blastococcus sp. SYSU D00820]